MALKTWSLPICVNYEMITFLNRCVATKQNIRFMIVIIES